MTGLAILFGYILIFVMCFFLVKAVQKGRMGAKDYKALKTVTFGDESTVTPNRAASVFSLLAIFLIWGMFTGSKLVPIHVSGPFLGDARFTYTAEKASGERDEAEVTMTVHEQNDTVEPTAVEAGDGFAKNDIGKVQVWRSTLIQVQDNDLGGKEDGYKIVEINGKEVSAGDAVKSEFGRISLTDKGTMFFEPKAGMQMQPLYLPSPEAVVSKFFDLSKNGYKNIPLFEHVWASLSRVLKGFIYGSIVGIPLGYAMGLSGWFRGWFDPIVEFMRPVPPLALIPLVIIWFGIGEEGKVVLLFLAALWIMAIAARAGVAGVNITKIRAAYSLGASKTQIMRHVIVPNSLPEIFTGARVAMGVCWGTVVAAELVAATKGVGMMIMNASKFSQTDIVIVGIILIGAIGFGIDVLMRIAEKKLVPWKGHS